MIDSDRFWRLPFLGLARILPDGVNGMQAVVFKPKRSRTIRYPVPRFCRGRALHRAIRKHRLHPQPLQGPTYGELETLSREFRRPRPWHPKWGRFGDRA